MEELILRAATYTAQDVAQLVTKLNGSLKQPFARLFQRNPAERHQTAAELEAELRACLDRLGAYGAKEAAGEIDRVLTATGAQLVSLEGGSLPEHRVRVQSPLSGE